MIITLSRQLGSEGDVIAARVAATLGLRLLDRETVHQAALAVGVPDDMLHRLMYEGQRSLASEILDTLGAPRPTRASPPSLSSPLLGVFAPMIPSTLHSLDEAARSVGLIIKDMANQGDVLVLGQGGQMCLRGYEGACHIQVVAPFDRRVERLAAREKLSAAAARRRIKDSDQARYEYLLSYHGVRWLDPLLYHIVINTGQTSIDAAVSLIIHIAHFSVGQR